MQISKVSVVVVAFNEEAYIKRCINALIGQEYPSFELIIVDDYSTDNTAEIVKGIKDNRITYIRNDKRRGIAYSRNAGIAKAGTEYIFFTDADCLPAKNWLREGIRVLENKDCLGVEGKTCYETSRTSPRDKVIENLTGRKYFTCNIAYRKESIGSAGYFNEDYELVSEDTDLARKILKMGNIEFAPDMLVFHRQKKQTVKSCFQGVFRVFSKVRYIKDTKDFRACFWKVMYPKHLVFLLCPPLLILRYRFITFKDCLFLFVIYFSYVFERILIWIAAIKEGIFLI